MDHMVYSALRRKLAAAKAIGDLDRIDLLRGRMVEPSNVPSEAPAVPVEVPAEVAPETDAPEIVEPTMAPGDMVEWNTEPRYGDE